MAPRLLGRYRFWALGLLLVLLALLPLGLSRHLRPRLPTEQPIDPLHNPLYASYRFEPSHLKVGVQPLWVPVSMLTEAWRRDLVLHQELARLGVSIDFYSFAKGDDAGAFIANGSLDAMVAGDAPTIAAASKKDLVLLGLIEQGYTSIVARHPMLIRDLKGKRVAYASGSNSHMLLMALGAEGLVPGDIDSVPMDAAQMPDALARGEIDALAAWEPTPSVALARSPGAAIIHRSLHTGYLTFSRDFLLRNPQATRLLLAAEIRAFRWLTRSHANSGRAADWALHAAGSFIQRPLPLSGDKLRELADADLLGFTTFPILNRRSFACLIELRDVFQFMQSSGLLPKDADWDRITLSLESEWMTEVLIHPVEYQLDNFQYSQEVLGAR